MCYVTHTKQNIHSAVDGQANGFYDLATEEFSLYSSSVLFEY